MDEPRVSLFRSREIEVDADLTVVRRAGARHVTGPLGDKPDAERGSSGGGPPQISTSGSRSTPFGQTTVPQAGSTRTRAKYAGSFSGSNMGPTGPANWVARSRSIVR